MLEAFFILKIKEVFFMSKIKQRESTKNIRTLNKAKDLYQHMKHSFVKTKEQAEENREIKDTPHVYATDSIFAKATELTKTTTYKVNNLGRRSFKKVPETVQNANVEVIRIKQKFQSAVNSIKSKGTVKNAGKTASKGVKTTKQTSQTSVKAAQATMKASQKAAQTAKAAAKVTAQTAKVTAKAIVAAVKATIAAVKGLITMIAAGGWVAIVIILVVCMVASLASSPFGIFYSNDEATPGNMTMTSVIKQIDQDFNNEIEKIKTENPHDEVDVITTPQNWRDVLAVYAVKNSANPDNPIEIVTIDNQKYEAIKSVFWDMNNIFFKLEKIELETVYDESSSTEQTNSKTILHIIIKNKSCSEMEAQYAFNSEQCKLLDEFMSDNLKSIWSELLK